MDIEVKKLKELLNSGLSEREILIDVRSPGEYRSGTIPGAVNMPLSEIDDHLEELSSYDTVYVHCQSGNRSSQACVTLHELEGVDIVDVEGGLNAWQEAGFEVQKSKGAGISIIRQVHLVAATLGLIGMFFGYFVASWMFLLTVLVLFGLMVSGLTGFCGMATLLSRAPWNK